MIINEKSPALREIFCFILYGQSNKNILKLLNMEDVVKKGKNWQFIVPIILAIVIAGIFIYLDYRNKPEPNNENSVIEYMPEPISPSENPRRAEDFNFASGYGCAGPQHLPGITVKEPNSVWDIKSDGTATRISLGKYKIEAPAKTVFDITKFWLYFFSGKLSEREDKIYALESSYVSRVFLNVNGYEKEVNLGGDEFMLIELDYPLGDLYPYDRKVVLEYEFIIEMKCKTVENGTCLDNAGNSLDYLNEAEIIPQIRLFATGCQEFDKDITIEASFKI